MDEIKQRLNKILDTERQGIHKKLDEARKKTKIGDGTLEPETQQRLLKHVEDVAARNQVKLNKLPPDVSGGIKELNHYNFMDEDAQNQFKELMDMLKKQAMELVGKNMIQNLKNMDPNALANIYCRTTCITIAGE